MSVKNQFSELTRKPYHEQAIWFLNGFWAEGIDAECEEIWKCAHKFIELDPKKKSGNELDEFWSHKFLESLGETLTVIQLREKLRKIDLDVNGKMALLEYLLFKYNKGVEACINSPQGDNREEIEEAQAKFEEVARALEELQEKLEAQDKALKVQQKALREQNEAVENQKRALAAQKKAEDEAKSALATQQAAEDLVRAAEAELKAAVDDLTAQENAFKAKLADLDQKSKDPNSTIVAKNKAANELAQLKQENPLPLRKAKLTQEAALRKVEKQRKETEIVTAAALAKANEASQARASAEAKARELEAKKRELEQRTRELEEIKNSVEASVRETESALQAAQAYLDEVKQKTGVAHGAIWWIERGLKEAQKYLPQKKQQL